MSTSDTVPALIGFIDDLVAAEGQYSLLRLVKAFAELRERSTILQLADAVNRMAREDLSRAERLAAAASYLADLLDDNYCRARTGRSTGNVQVLRGQYSRALETFEISLTLFQTLGEELDEAATLSSSLQALIYLGRYEDAFEKARKAQIIAKRHHDELLLARLEINFGNIFHRQDRFSDAVKHYECAFATLERLGQHRDCAVAAGNMAVCYISLNDFRQAELAYKKTKAISEREDMPMLVAQADYNIAYLHYYRGEHNLAIRLYQQTRLYCERVGDRYHGALCDLDQSEMYLELHLNREASELAQQALTTFETMKMSYEAAKATVFLGVAAYQDRKPFRALEFLAISQEQMSGEQNLTWVAVINFYRALILQQEGRFYEALRHCKQAQSFYAQYPDSGKWVLVQSLRAALHLSIEEVKEAEDWSDRAIACAESLNSPVLLARAYWVRGLVCESTVGNAHQSFDWYLKSLRSLEAAPSRLGAEEMKIPFSKNRMQLYEALVSLAPELRDATNRNNIFEFMEKGKSRDLAEQIAFRSHAISSPQKGRSALAERVKALREELSWYYRRADHFDLQRATEDKLTQNLHLVIREREKSLVKTLDELHVTDVEFHAIQTGSVVPLERIRRALSPDEMILEFYQARGNIYACLIDREALRVEQLTTVEKARGLLELLGAQFSKYRLGKDYPQRFSSMLTETVQGQLGALYTELIEPFRSYLIAKRLIIVPDGFLNYLPFHAFFDGANYLGDQYIVSYAGSASAYFLALNKQKQPGAYDHDLVLDSDELRGNFSVARKIGAVLPRSKVISREDLSVEILSKHGPASRFIHFDTRVAPHPNNPLLSTWFLGNDRLSVLDTFNLSLPCSLISLTGTGPGLRSSGNGEEINLLARALDYAGAQSVLMPLWTSDDAPTASLMETFYKIADSESDKGFALQQAIIVIRDRFPSPYHWAPYVLRGSTGRLS